MLANATELSVAAHRLARHSAIRGGGRMSFEFTLYDALLSIDVPAQKGKGQ